MESTDNKFKDEGAISRGAHLEVLKRERLANSPWKKFKRNHAAVVGLVIVAVMVFVAVFAPLLAPFDPYETHISESFLKPGTNGYLLGTDEYGRDLLSRMIYGARMSVGVALGSTLLGGIIGIILGLTAGFFGGIIDAVIMRIMDGMFAFPFILLAIFLVTIFGPGTGNVILAIGIVAIPSFARVVRGQVLVVKNEEFCNAERVLGASKSRILFYHILPNAVSQIIVYATLSIANAIISEASLSFLGLGILTPMASWGNILRAGKASMNSAPYISVIAGIFILVTVIGFNLFGDGVRDMLDPKSKR